jgi:hypothetical protein
MSFESSDSDALGAVGHAEESAIRQQQVQLKQTIAEEINAAGKQLAGGSAEGYAAATKALVTTIIPLLETYTSRPLSAYDDRVGDDDDWYWQAIWTVQNDGRALFQRVEAGNGAAKETARRALEAAATVAAHEGIVLDEYAGRVDVHGFAGKIGENMQDREMDLGDPVRLVSLRSGALKTLFTGGTGNGKSVALETEAEDYYKLNFRDGRDYKVIDPAGLRDGENWLYDIPQQDPSLQRARGDLGLPETFADADRENNRIDIRVPLTPSLRDQELPFDMDDERFTVQPFTIPAADIRKPLLISILTAKLTPEQESVIRDAYDEVDRREDDWALVDLADEIKTRDELKESKRRPAIRTLRQLQHRGFIRTSSCEYTLQWRDIFEDTKTYTVFSQSFLDTAIAQLIVFGYLAHSIVKKRESMYNIPESVVVMRELWKIAPHNRRQEFDERAAQLQEAIGNMFSRLFRDNRHSGVHILTDTQQPSDLLKPIREMFNRYAVFETDKDTVKDIFEWTANDNWKSFYSTLTPQPGEASVTGMVEPAIDERHIQFVGPVQYAPPSHHHKRDKGIDSNGWRARAKYFTPTETCPDCECDSLERSDDGETVSCPECGHSEPDLSLGRDERLRQPDEQGVDWPFDVPTHLLIESEGGDGSDGINPALEPVAAFAKACLRYDAGESAIRDRVKMAFNEFVLDHPDIEREEPWDFDDRAMNQRFGRRLKKAIDGEIGRGYKDGEYAYKHLTLTRRGQAYLNEATDGLEDSAEPLTDR